MALHTKPHQPPCPSSPKIPVSTILRKCQFLQKKFSHLVQNFSQQWLKTLIVIYWHECPKISFPILVLWACRFLTAAEHGETKAVYANVEPPRAPHSPSSREAPVHLNSQDFLTMFPSRCSRFQWSIRWTIRISWRLFSVMTKNLSGRGRQTGFNRWL